MPWGASPRQDLMAHPSLGKSFEGYAVELILQLNTLFTPQYEPFFFRTSDGIEVDLVLQKGRQIVPIEIKAGLSPSLKSVKSLEKSLTILRAKKAYVVHLGKETYPVGKNITAIGIHHWRKEGLGPFWH